jgi:positive regulator of sigma E activity
LIAGAAVGAFLHERVSISQDPATLLGAAIGFIAAFLPVILFDRLAAGKTKYIPSILKVINPSSCTDSPRVTNPPD